MIDLIRELSKAFPHNIFLTKANLPDVKKVQSVKPFKMKPAC